MVAGGSKPSFQITFMRKCMGSLPPGGTGKKVAVVEAICRRFEPKRSYTKQEISEDKARRAALRAERPPPAFAGATTTTRPTGLISSRQAPPGMERLFHATGHWAGSVGGQWYLVYAGARSEYTTGQGAVSAVVVYREAAEVDSGTENTLLGEYAPPGGGTAALHIRSVEGDVLRLATEDGESFAFDVATNAFVE
jgi:hypothetical protein